MSVTKVEKAVTRQRFDSPQQEAFLNLWRTYDRLKMLEDDLFGRYELSAQQYNALRLLRAAHPDRVPTLALAGQLVSRAPDITRLLDRLDARGLIVRERPAADRRTVFIGISDAGLALLAELAEALRACHDRQLGHLTAEEVRLLVALLHKARAPHEPPDSNWR
jgi:DNA-binding MarR family transcriptional regulator